MARRGKKRQLEVEARYWQLLASGIGTVEACRRVGITRKTGYRWRAEAGGVAPLRLAEAVRSNRYLSMVERQRIAGLRSQGLTIREIARRLERSPSTVTRELRRNTSPTMATTTPYSRICGRVSVARARAAVDSRAIRSSARWCRRSSSSSGVRSRSPRTCVSPTPIDRAGICATRPSIRRSTEVRALACIVGSPSDCARSGHCANAAGALTSDVLATSCRISESTTVRWW